MSRSSSTEVRISWYFSLFVYLSRGTLPPKKGKRALLGDLAVVGGGTQDICSIAID